MLPRRAGKEVVTEEMPSAPAAVDAIRAVRSSLNEAKRAATLAEEIADTNADHQLFRNIRTRVEHLESDVIEEVESSLRARRRVNAVEEEEDDDGDEGIDKSAAPELARAVETLDPQLRHCLLCVAAFPERRLIKKRLLIHWWIGEGAVRCASSGNRCFAELASRGLIVPADTRPHCDRAHACTVHPLVHRYVKFTAKSCAFFIPVSVGDSGTHGRMLLREARRGGLAPHAVDHGKLVTLYNVSEKYVEFDEHWLAKQRSLRVLQLGQWRSHWTRHIEAVDAKFLHTAGRRCRNLTYLSLRGMSNITALPDAIGELSGLSVLDMRSCHNLEELPPSLGALEALEYLDVSGCHLLEQMPGSMKKLARLEVVKGFVISGMRTRGDPCHLADLSGLTKLWKLSLTIRHHAMVMPEDDIERHLGVFHELRVLTITWGSASPATASPATEVVSFPPDLEKLDLRRMPYRSPPRWFHPNILGHVKRLYIRGGAIKSLGSGDGWTVETLRLRFLTSLRCEWAALRRSFPELRHVEQWECTHLGSWLSLADERGVWRKETEDAAAKHANGPCPWGYYQFFLPQGCS